MLSSYLLFSYALSQAQDSLHWGEYPKIHRCRQKAEDTAPVEDTAPGGVPLLEVQVAKDIKPYHHLRMFPTAVENIEMIALSLDTPPGQICLWPNLSCPELCHEEGNIDSRGKYLVIRIGGTLKYMMNLLQMITNGHLHSMHCQQYQDFYYEVLLLLYNFYF